MPKAKAKVAPATHDDRPKRAKAINRQLTKLYPDAHCELHFRNPLELLVATILSAQCTDKRVNLVTPALFERYPDAAAFAAAEPADLQRMIQSTGFFRNKAKHIKECCRKLVAEHGGQVPNTMPELLQLPGVARKTANVVLGNAFAVPGLTVDTHFARLTKRLGLTDHKDPVKIERDLATQLPAKEWTDFSHRLIWHGRRICHARKPLCPQCVLNPLCPKIGVEQTEMLSKIKRTKAD